MAGPDCRVALVVMALSALYANPAWSQEDDPNKSVATDLFDSGVRMMEEGGCDRTPVGDRAVCERARDSFQRAYALYPAGLGALRNLAFVEENLGLIASAARNFRELTRRAPHDPNPARRLWADFARKEAEALAPRIPHLTIDTQNPPPGMKILLDGKALPDAGWGTPLEVDPGPHTVRAEAPGREAFEESFELAEQDQKDLKIVLEESSGAEDASAPGEASTRPKEPEASPLRTVALVVAGVGVVTVGVGLGLGYVAIKKRQDACGDSQFCEPDGLESGRSVARASTIVTGIGLATLAGGLAWYFLQPSPKTEARARVLPALGPNVAGVEAYGTF
jgi:hypothetical protein